jgi:hypothetical protein
VSSARHPTIPEDVRRRLKLASEERNGHRSETFTAADLMALKLQEVRWAVPGIVPEGYATTAGGLSAARLLEATRFLQAHALSCCL